MLVKGFTPSAESSFNSGLEYSNLEAEAGKILYEHKLNTDIESGDAEIHKLSAMRKLDSTVLAYLAFRSVDEDNIDIQKRWSSAFTDKSIELFGEPDYKIAENLKNGETQFGFERARQAVSEYIGKKYARVYEAMNIGEFEGPLSANDIADKFEIGLSALAADDTSWDKWSVVRDEAKDSLSVSANKIIVGMNRRAATPQQVIGLFAHEVLRHAQTRVNGAKKDKMLSTGLPEYLDFEEGAGVFYEYATTGILKDELVDRYVDIATALGMGDKSDMVPRSELLETALDRERLRNESRDDDEKLSDEVINKKVYAHINRIYRGTPGSDDVIGVFTKDIAYLEGFMKVGRYIEDRLSAGDAIEDIMDYISQGKFDPTNSSHVKYIEDLGKPKPSTDIVRYNN